jgi:hypothetical protein
LVSTSIPNLAKISLRAVTLGLCFLPFGLQGFQFLEHVDHCVRLIQIVECPACSEVRQ